MPFELCHISGIWHHHISPLFILKFLPIIFMTFCEDCVVDFELILDLIYG